MGNLQKAIWMILVGCLLKIELKAIKVDRETAARDALGERAQQDRHFDEVRLGQEKDFKKLAEGFSVTERKFRDTQIALTATLKTAEVTRNQTKPDARLRVYRTGMRLSPGGDYVPGNQIVFSVIVTN
jgi:hypothetical protein